MCGIGGILRVWPTEQRELALRTPHDQSIPEHWLNVIDDAIKHRGPDGQGRFRDRTIRADGCVVDVALVHRRLSIIDHAGGHQPMVLRIPRTQRAPSASSGTSISSSPEAKNTPGRLLTPEDLTAHNRRLLAEGHDALASQDHDHIAVVFNGCIYNHRELRAELQRAGHVFHTDHSDTEVLVHGWREWGSRMCSKLDGMFSLVVWDSGDLLMARDRAGEKPLYECIPKKGDLLIFGSTAASVLRCGVAGGSSEVASIPEDSRWLLHDCWIRFGFAERPPTSWVQEVQPGDQRLATIDNSHLVCHVYTGTPLPERGNNAPTVDQIDAVLDAAVRSRLDSDVPLSGFLSGGVDSSLVSFFARRARGELDTFSVKMPDHRFDESEWASKVAGLLGTRHHTLDCSPSPTSDLISLVESSGVPLGDSSLLPTHWICRAARDYTRVAIGGDGGDELFGGYERYRACFALNRWHKLLSLLPKRFASGHPKDLGVKLNRLVNAAQGDGYPELLSIFGSDDLAAILKQPHSSNRFRSTLDPLGDDFGSYLPQDILRKTDTASMAVALELRSPLLARDLVQTCLAAPLASLMPHGQRKGLLRQVARKYLPAEIVDRPKMGFSIPIGEWFRTDYGGLRTMLLDHLNSSEPFGPPSLGIDLNRKFIQQMLDEHLGTGMSGRVTRDHSQRLYMLLVLSIWAKWYASLSK